MIKYVFFDWNGTLLADTNIRYTLSNRGLKIMGHPGLSRADYHKHHVIPHNQYLRNIGLSKETIAKHGQAEREDFHAGYAVAVKSARTRKGAKALLEDLRNRHITCIVLSNHTQQDIKKQSQRLKIDRYFDTILANDNIHAAANQGKIGLLQTYIKSSHVKPAEAVIIGDTVEEILIGQQLGMKTVAITGAIHTKSRLQQESPDAVIGSLYALIDIIREW